MHGVSVKTISKWKCREFTEDNSSRPYTIHYKLTSIMLTLKQCIAR